MRLEQWDDGHLTLKKMQKCIKFPSSRDKQKKCLLAIDQVGAFLNVWCPGLLIVGC